MFCSKVLLCIILLFVRYCKWLCCSFSDQNHTKNIATTQALPKELVFVQVLGCISFFQGAGDVWFSLRGTTYHNNSNVILEDISEGDDALLCITNQTACCRSDSGGNGSVLGNWFFPNGSRIPGYQWNFYRTRGQMVVRLHRRRGGVEGIYRCEIPDTMNVMQTIYIGVYSASTGE